MQDDKRIEILLTAETRQMRKALNRATNELRRFGNRAERGSVQVERAFRRQERAARRMQTAVAQSLQAVVAGLSAREVGRYADSWTNAGNKIGTVAERLGQDASEIREDLFGLAQDTRSAFSGTITNYTRLATATEELEVSHRALITASSALSKTYIISGAEAQEAAGSAIQFAQGLASGKLAGDELRSVMEGNVVLSGLLAKQLGVTRGELRQLGADGKITAEVALATLIENAEELDKQFRKMTPTIEQGWQVFTNGVTRYIGETSDANKIAATFSNSLILLGDNIDIVAQALIMLGGVALARNFGPALLKSGQNTVKLTRAGTSLNAVLRKNANDTLEAARATRAAAIADQRKALAAQRAAAADVESARNAKAKALANQRLIVTQDAVAAGARKVSLAKTQQAAAMAAATRATNLAALAMRRFASASALVGGPVGIALVALTALPLALKDIPSPSDQAAGALERLGDVMNRVGANSDNLAQRLLELNHADLEEFTRDATRELSEMEAAIDRFTGTSDLLTDSKFEQAMRIGGGLSSEYRQAARELGSLLTRVKDGEVTLDQLRNALVTTFNDPLAFGGNEAVRKEIGEIITLLDSDLGQQIRQTQREMLSLRETLNSPDFFFATRIGSNEQNGSAETAPDSEEFGAWDTYLTKQRTALQNSQRLYQALRDGGEEEYQRVQRQIEIERGLWEFAERAQKNGITLTADMFIAQERLLRSRQAAENAAQLELDALREQEQILEQLADLDKARVLQKQGLTRSEADLLDTLSIRAQVLQDEAKASGEAADELTELAVATGMSKLEATDLIAKLALLHPQFAAIAEQAAEAAARTREFARAEALVGGRAADKDGISENETGNQYRARTQVAVVQTIRDAEEAAERERKKTKKKTDLERILEGLIPESQRLHAELTLIEKALEDGTVAGRALTEVEIERLTQEAERLRLKLNNLGVDFEALAQGFADISSNALDDAFDALFSAPEDRMDNFKETVRQFGLDILDLLKQTAINALKVQLGNAIIGSLGGLGGGAGAFFRAFGQGLGGTPALADGGIMRGPGGPRDDAILARLSNGEAVIPAKSVARYPELTARLIKGDLGGLPAFKDGGLIKMPATPDFAKANQMAAANQSYTINAPITINMQPTGNAQADQAAADQLSRAMRRELEAIVDGRLARARRPGNR